MKKKISLVLSSLFVLSMITVFSVVTSNAQTSNIKAQVPFAFNVNDKVVPEGTYNVRPVKSLIRGLWALQDAKGKNIALIAAQTVAAPFDGNPTLVFRSYGENYFLAEIRSDYMTITLSKSSSEEKLIRETKLAKGKTLAPKIVAITVQSEKENGK